MKTGQTWPYWIPDPFNMAVLGIVALAVVGAAILWSVKCDFHH